MRKNDQPIWTGNVGIGPKMLIRKRFVLHRVLVLLAVTTLSLFAGISNAQETTTDSATIVSKPDHEAGQPGTGYTDKDFTVTIPFEWSGGMPTIKVMIAGKEHRFLFDTAAPTIIPENLVDQLHLQTVGPRQTLNDSAGRHLDRSLYKLPLLKTGDAAFRDFGVFTGNFENNFPFSCLGFDGILGYTFFKDLNVKLDYSKQEITLSDNQIPHDGYIPVDIQFEPVHGPLITARFPFGDAYFEIDTGKNAGIQLGDPGVIPEFQKQGYVSRKMSGTFSSSIGGVNTDSLEVTYLARDFSIGAALPIRSFPISVDNSGAFLIGNDFLKHFTIILDLQNQKAYFQGAGKNVIEEGFKDTFGFTPFWTKETGLTISAITENTPASSAGLQIGDRILSMNNKDVSAMNADGFCLLLRYPTLDNQRALDITYQRDDDKPDSITLGK